MTGRRHPKNRDPGAPQEKEIFKRGGQDVGTPRVKGAGHKKKTADKWNQ